MLEKEKTNIKTILMYVVGIFLIISMATYLGRNLLVAILMGLLGIAILPPINEKINERFIKGNKNKNIAKIILEVALFFVIVSLLPRTAETTTEEIAKGENVTANNVEENTQNTINTVNVTNTTNTQDEEQVSNVSVENTIKETVQPKQEEPKSSTPSSSSSTASSSSKASTSTSTSSSTQSKSTKQTTSSSTTKQSSSGSSTSSNTQNSQTVYVTPTGKRYHLSPTCGGKNSTATTLSNAKSMGLTPCKKCAQ